MSGLQGSPVNASSRNSRYVHFCLSCLRKTIRFLPRSSLHVVGCQATLEIVAIIP